MIDTMIQDIYIYNTYFKTFYLANVYIQNGLIYYIDQKQSAVLEVKKIIDGKKQFMIPGLIDIHMHIESSMMTPKAFCEKMACCGVTTIVSEPHEMANVNGIQGVIDMISSGKDSKIDVYYGIPSSVPSTRQELETTGGIIDIEQMKELKKNPQVICVGEIMNYRQIIKENNLEITKFLTYLKKEDPDFVIEGHCPSLVNLDLAKFLFLGINGDHTEHTMEELEERFQNGMYVEIQEKMLKKEVIDYIKKNNLYGYFGFVTDDVMADTLIEEGHLDGLVRKAIKLGLSPEQAIYHATYTNAMRMHLYDRGVLVPGKKADFVFINNLEGFSVTATYKDGKNIYEQGKQEKKIEKYYFPDEYYHSVKISRCNQAMFQIPVDKKLKEIKVRVISVQDGTTQTEEKQIMMKAEDGYLQWENTEYCLAIVIERYGKSNNHVGYGFVTGDCIKSGAVATTYAHDSHNLLVVGENSIDMLLAINRIIELQGGIVVTKQNQLQAELPLPVGGILSDNCAENIGKKLAQVRSALIKQGYCHYNPIMSLCTLALPVSPSLKLTDKGLIDVKKGKLVSLFIE